MEAFIQESMIQQLAIQVLVIQESKMQVPTILMVLESNEVLRIQEHSKVQRTNETLKIEEPLKVQKFEQSLKIYEEETFMCMGLLVKEKCMNIVIKMSLRVEMVRTRLRATSPGPQQSRDASSNPHCDRQSAPTMHPSPVQHVQSIAAAMAELTRQNQELVRQLNLRRQRREWDTEGQTQSQEDGRNVELESQSRGTAPRRVPHLEREMDQMRRVMDEMRENMRKTNPVEDLVHRTNSPFVASINAHPLPPKFKMHSLDSYDGTWDPFDHIATFKTTMHLQGVSDEIMCRAFPTTLKGPARVWFSKIPPKTMTSFKELSKLFVNNFIGWQRHKRSSSSLLTIEQGENESLRSFITRFNKETLTVDEVDDKLLLAAFHNGVNSDLFIHKLYEKEPQSMAELVHSAQNFMNAEDTIIAKKRKRAERMETNRAHHSE
ncbi:uncharacterized protein LOC136062143 [Quercus suber]|uniref:uncharacterized protein LOC136062143 n=1 Tax=Quercus suber TaxID=58331 RepID=UPI0032DFE2E3